jgi:putrescine aminotransferase
VILHQNILQQRIIGCCRQVFNDEHDYLLASRMVIGVDDSQLYTQYRDLVSSTYPAFLEKYGMSHCVRNAKGAVITDSAGKNYIDCVSGYGIFNVGHNHPKIIHDVIYQIQQHQLFTRPLINQVQVEAAKSLARISPDDLNCSFLCNSGSEAIDSAIKLARLCTGKTKIITAENSYHGFTYGGLSATGIPSFHTFFKPLVPDIIQVPFNESHAIEKIISDETAAVLLEPIQHESGVNIPDEDYLHEVRRICDDHDTLFILDEIKTGMGKTGSMFACEQYDVVPDVLVLGKSLSGGIMPVGAMIASKKLWNKFSLSFPMSASSFAGNTLACRAIRSTIHVIQEEGLDEASNRKGTVLFDALTQLVHTYDTLFERVSGKGLLIGLKTTDRQTAFTICKHMIQRGVLVFPSYGDSTTIMIEPPLVISSDQIQKVINTLQDVCHKMG